MNLMRSKTVGKIVNNIFFRVLRADGREQPAILVGFTLLKFRESAIFGILKTLLNAIYMKC